MRILFWSEAYKPMIGGIETMAGRFLEVMRARGHELLVVTRRDTDRLPEQEVLDGIPVRRFPFYSALSVRGMELIVPVQRQIAELKRSYDPDLIHIYGLGPSLFFHHKTRNSAGRAGILVTLHGPIADFDPKGFVALTLGSAGAIVGCSNDVVKGLIGMMPLLEGRAVAVHNAAPVPEGIPSPLPWNPPRLLCVGRLSREKGFDVALDAFAIVKKRVPNVRLEIVGDGTERDVLGERILYLGLGDQAALSGWAAPDAIPPLMEAATMVLVPSRSEPFGLVALEAALMQRPVVAAAVGGLPEVVSQGETGFLVQPENPDALAEAVLRLLENRTLAERMGRAARARALEDFSLETHVSRYEELYARITGNAPGFNEV